MTQRVDWSHRGEYMHTRHGVTPTEANDALTDPDAVTIDPDPASLTGDSVRVIGQAHTTGRIITVIILDHEGTRYGVNGWPANTTDQKRYNSGGDIL